MSEAPVHVMTVVGARPQFVKAAVVAAALDPFIGRGEARHTLVHTGQHHDHKMSQLFFDELGIPEPDVHLGIHGGTHGAMTGRMLGAIEGCMLDDRPDWLLVYGDTNSTLAGALAAAKLGVRVAHVEAGLRSFNRAMPEEINRVLTDHVSDVLFAPTRAAVANLDAEGIRGERVVRTGDVMYDAARHYRRLADERSTLVADLGLEPGGFALATLHRQENTDDPARLGAVVDGLCRVSERLPVVLPVHPRTAERLRGAGLWERARGRLRTIEPVGYLDMLALEASARMILTDSGGVQKEAYFQGVVCLTMRDETEWVELVEAGANVLVGADADAIARGAFGVLDRGLTVATGDLYGDGCAAQHIAERLVAGVAVG